MLRKGSLTGLLLFGIFFGAGNLIFPNIHSKKGTENGSLNRSLFLFIIFL